MFTSHAWVLFAISANSTTCWALRGIVVIDGGGEKAPMELARTRPCFHHRSRRSCASDTPSIWTLSVCVPTIIRAVERTCLGRRWSAVPCDLAVAIWRIGACVVAVESSVGATEHR